METLSSDKVFRLRVAQAVTIALLLLVAIVGHRVEMQAGNSGSPTQSSPAQLY